VFTTRYFHHNIECGITFGYGIGFGLYINYNYDPVYESLIQLLLVMDMNCFKWYNK
jgi:hypothetical protein